MTSSDIALRSEPITKLFPKIAMPIVLALIVSGLYNVVDAIFIVKGVNQNAFGGVSLVLPIQLVIFAFADLIGSGAATIISRYYGAEQIHRAQKTAGMAIVISVGASILFTVIALLMFENILLWLKTTPALMPYAKEYAFPIILFSPVIFISSMFNDIIRAEGKVVTMMSLILIASLLNIVLDAVFIYIFEMGVAGAAYATILAQLIAIIIAIYLYTTKKLILKPVFKSINWNISDIAKMIGLGIPLFLGLLGVSLSTALVNREISTLAVETVNQLFMIFGVISRLFMFVSMVPLAMMIAYQTIASYNFGSKDYQRVKQGFAVASLYTIGYGLLVSFIMYFFPNHILDWFISEEKIVNEAVKASQIIFFCFSLYALTMIISGLYQSIGLVKKSVLIASSRVFLFMFPLLFLLPYYFGEVGVWLVFPASDILAFSLAAILLLKLNLEEAGRYILD